MGDWNDEDLPGVDRLCDRLHWRRGTKDAGDLWNVVRQSVRTVRRRVETQDDLSPGDAAEFSQPRPGVRPMMDREHRDGCVEGIRPHGKRLGIAAKDMSTPRVTLSDHDRGRLDG
jgi:hypothetical protein